MGRYLIFSDFTDGTGVTVSNSTVPQVIKTWTLDQSDAYNIIVTAVFRITTAATTGVAQAVNLTVTIGSNTRTFAFNSKAAIDDDYVSVIYAAESRAGDVVTAQLNGSASNDTQTTVNVKTFLIEQISP